MRWLVLRPSTGVVASEGYGGTTLPHAPIVIENYFPIMCINLSVVVIDDFLIGTIDSINLTFDLLLSFTLRLSYFSL